MIPLPVFQKRDCDSCIACSPQAGWINRTRLDTCLWRNNPIIPKDFRPDVCGVIFEIETINNLACFNVIEVRPKAARDRQMEQFLYLLQQSCVVILKEFGVTKGMGIAGPEHLLDIVRGDATE